VSEGKPQAYRREDVVYYGDQFAIHSFGIMGTIAREGCALYVEAGTTTGAGSASAVGWAREFGATTIGGTVRWANNGWWALLGDYPMIMDDVYAAGAICSEDELVKSSQVSGDLAKLALVVIVILGVVVTLAGRPVADWLKI
jgi:hypothetical protein